MAKQRSKGEKDPNDLVIPQTIVCTQKGWLYDSTNGRHIKASNIQQYLRTKAGLPAVKLPRKGQYMKPTTQGGSWIDNYYGN